MRHYSDLFSPEVPSALRTRPIVLPVGAIEQHGPHLPLSVDVDIATGVAEAVTRQLDGVAAPPLSYGARSLPASGGGPTFPGTIHMRAQTLVDMLADVLIGYLNAGAHELLVVNGHYENEALVFEALDGLRERGALEGARVMALSWWSAVPPELLKEAFSEGFPGWHCEHAGLTETSLMLYLHPDRVGKDRPDHDRPPPAGVYMYPYDAQAITSNGVLYRTSGASADLGAALLTAITDWIVEKWKEDSGAFRS